jgi:cytochrome c oxidase subunit 2
LVLRAGLALVVGLAAAALASAEPSPALAPTNIFAPESTHAWIIYRYTLLIFAITGAIFVVVGGLLVYAIVRFRQRKGDETVEPAQVYGSEQVEIAWTVIPVIVVIVLVLTTARTIHEIQDAPRPPGALEVTVIGHQWWWEFRYPKLGIVTANELHIPVSEPRDPTPTFLRLLSADVAHSFWVPRLAGKTDLIPNRANQMWMDPPQPGLYLGQCAEYCGTQHAKMLLRVYVHTRDDFSHWVAAQKAPATVASAAASGKRVFETTACLNCHAVAGTVASGRFGPDLTHFMSRDTLAAGAAKNTAENLKLWIKDPSALKPGALMPPMHLGDQELDELVSYLVTLK